MLFKIKPWPGARTRTAFLSFEVVFLCRYLFLAPPRALSLRAVRDSHRYLGWKATSWATLALLARLWGEGRNRTFWL